MGSVVRLNHLYQMFGATQPFPLANGNFNPIVNPSNVQTGAVTNAFPVSGFPAQPFAQNSIGSSGPLGSTPAFTIPLPVVPTFSTTATTVPAPALAPIPSGTGFIPPAVSSIPLPTGFTIPLPIGSSTPIPPAVSATISSATSAIPSPVTPKITSSASVVWTEERRRQWVTNLQAFIYKLLKDEKAVPEKLLGRFVDEKSMPYWITAYTDLSYSTDDNYDQLEYYGDRVLETAFAKYLLRTFPGINEGQMTNLKSFYMSKVQQSELAKQLGMPEQMRMRGNRKAHFNLFVDVFESTFGALMIIGDNIVEGLGSVVTYNLLKAIFDKIDVDPRRGGAPRTQVDQFFTRFDKDAPILDEISLPGGSYQAKIILGPGQLEFLNGYLHSVPLWQSFNLTLKDPVIIAERTASTQIEATNEAYIDALTFLNNLGITTAWAKGTKRIYDKSLPGVKEYVAQALQKSGFKDIYFDIPNKWSTKTIALVQLIGTNDDGGHQEILGTLNAPQTERRGSGFLPTKQKLIKDYVNGIINE